jgi:ubiquinone/menaquinone biosynthesis C-methylase UbiE
MGDVKRFYESVDFDRMITEPPRLIAECIERENGIIRESRASFGDVLEVGCGSGRILKMLRGAGRIVGIDFCEAMVRRGRADCSGSGVAVCLMSADRLDFPYESFDTVLCLNHTMSNMPGIEQDVLREMCRVCRRGGRIMMSVYSERARDVQVENYLRLGLHIGKEEKMPCMWKKDCIQGAFHRAKYADCSGTWDFPAI